MENRDVIELLDVLYGMVTEAWSVPLGNDKCIIEREKAVEIINDIKASLPTSIAEAKRLVSARDEFIGNAKREAEAMRKNAEEKARTMVEEQEVIRVANSFYAQMLSDADSMQSITDALLLCEAARPGCEVKIEVKAEENSGGSLMDEIEEF